MKKTIFTILALWAINFTHAEVVHVESGTVLNDGDFTSVVIEGKDVNFSFWGFEASGFQIDGNNDFVGMVDADGSANLARLEEGDLIDASSDFVTPSGYAPAYHSSMFGAPEDEIVMDGASIYFGFKVIDGANEYYAWLKLTRNTENEVVIDEYAYENVAGSAINAGDIAGGGAGDASIKSTIKTTFAVYPNPAKDQIRIKGIDLHEIQNCRVLGTNGALYLDVDSNFKAIDFTRLKPGVYIVELTLSSGELTHQRVIKS